MTRNPQQLWHPGSLTGTDSIAEMIAAKDLNNLYRASCFFTEIERYRAFCALYAVMRLVDDCVDAVLSEGLDSDAVPHTQRILVAWEHAVSAAMADQLPSSAEVQATKEPRAADVLDAFGRGIARFPVEPSLWSAFFDAMKRDLERDRFQTFEEFLRYARGATVAPTTIYLYLITAEQGTDGVFRIPADFDLQGCGYNLGLFAYVSHVLRDLRQDLVTGEKGLVYLAGDDMAAHRVTEETLLEDLGREHASPALKALVEDLAGRADTWRRAGEAQLTPLKEQLPADRMFVLRLIVRLYMATLEKIAACDFDPMTEHHLLTDADKERLALTVAAETSAAGI
jgi:phytoene synthase